MTISFIFKNIHIESLYDIFNKNTKAPDVIYYSEIAQTLQKQNN